MIALGDFFLPSYSDRKQILIQIFLEQDIAARAPNDLAGASELARRMVTRYGMRGKAGRVFGSRADWLWAFSIFLNISLFTRDQLVEQAFFLHQVTIGSHFFDFAGFQHPDFIEVFDDIQSVDHRNQGGLAL